MTITIRPVETIQDTEHFQRLTQMIWESPPEDLVPTHVAITVVHNGGAILGAYSDAGPAETGGMVGTAFWFPGLGAPTTVVHADAAGQEQVVDCTAAPAVRPCLKMCSHMAGVLPAWQGKGIGLELKVAQRALIRGQGLTDWVTWTYDPLLRTNAVLNIHRLGAVCNTYHENLYGAMSDGLNAGTPSDRCQVDWWLDSRRVSTGLAPAAGHQRTGEEAGAQRVPTRRTPAGLPAPAEHELHFERAALLIPLPDDINVIRRVDAELGLAWRLFLRRALQQAFGAHYVMVDCILIPGAGWHYRLERSPA